MKDFIANYEHKQEIGESLEKEILELQTKAYNLGEELSNKRIFAASYFEENIIQSLRMLAINDAEFKCEISVACTDDMQPSHESLPDIDQYDKFGFNKIKYTFAANKGAPLQDLKATISGGELSRLLLVIKSLLAQKMPERTIIFDEIDVGIGGKTAIKLGEYIKQISQSHQIICISHLPQIAAFADHHLKIEKTSDSERSLISFHELTGQARKEEIARMLSGNITPTSLQHAEELLSSRV
jgi:DNA repair protein RecN (Recombination protein N)